MARLSPDHPLAKSLELRRERCNQLVRAYALSGRDVDDAVFFDVLAVHAAPIAEAAYSLDPECIGRVSDALFAGALELTARGLIGEGSRVHSVDALWRDVLPEHARYVVAHPQRTIASLTNAVVRLHGDRVIDPQAWLDRLMELAIFAPEVDTLLDAGKVLAWSMGVAHWREGALEAMESLGAPLVRRILGVEDDSPETEDLSAILHALTTRRWKRLGAPPRKAPGAFATLEVIGAWRGYGGEFTTPPIAMKIDEQVYVMDEEICYSVHADAYGRTLKRFGPELPEGELDEVHDASLAADGTLSWGEATEKMAVMHSASSAVTADGALFVTLEHSHHVRIVVPTGELE